MMFRVIPSSHKMSKSNEEEGASDLGLTSSSSFLPFWEVSWALQCSLQPQGPPRSSSVVTSIQPKPSNQTILTNQIFPTNLSNINSLFSLHKPPMASIAGKMHLLCQRFKRWWKSAIRSDPDHTSQVVQTEPSIMIHEYPEGNRSRPSPIPPSKSQFLPSSGDPF